MELVDLFSNMKKLKTKLYNCLACTMGMKHLCINNNYGTDKSYTCCNIEVNEPAGTEVMCKCGEWCETKGAE